jgi:XisI protein
MDKAIKNKIIVRKVVEDIYKISPSDEKVETQIIIDDVHGHYLLHSVGWENTYREYATFVHIDVKPDGKVWIQHDGTDLEISDMLESEGIPTQEMVLGFRTPARRELTPEYALC